MTQTLPGARTGIEVLPAEPMLVGPETFPWLGSQGSVNRVHVTLPDSTEFLYGSTIALHNGIKKIAESVRAPHPESTQNLLFQALPDLLEGNRHPNIGKVTKSRQEAPIILGASRNVAKLPRLLFTIQDQEQSVPTVYRLGISMPSDHTRLLKLIGISPPNKSAHRK